MQPGALSVRTPLMSAWPRPASSYQVRAYPCPDLSVQGKMGTLTYYCSPSRIGQWKWR
jgi:hypothetical protein